MLKTACLTLAVIGLFAIASAEAAAANGASPIRTAYRANVDSVRYMGTIRSIFGKSLNVANVGNSTVKFEVSDQAKVTLNGKQAALSDLRTGYRVTVTASQINGKLVATFIEAASAEQ